MKRLYILVLFFMLAVCFCSNVSAQDYLMYESSLEGASFHQDSSTVVLDSIRNMYGGSIIDSDYFVKNVISLQIKDNEGIVFPDSFSCSVKVAIEEYDVNGNEITTIKVLHVTYNDRNLALDTLRSFYQFNSKYKVKDSIISITYNGITGAPDIFVLTNSMQILRQYTTVFCGFNLLPGPVNTLYLPSQDELLVKWTVGSSIPGLGYDEFDFEWTFYDDSSTLIRSTIPYGLSPYDSAAFVNNATRIETPNTWYQIPLLYEEGYVMFRIRTVQVLPTGQRMPGPWTTITYAGNNAFIYHITGHQDSLNWQAKTSFAEEGKRKSVVSYFDGASKNRQSVTKINTDTMTIVAETIYDYEGRPVVNTLPSPSFKQLIKHFDSFNQDIHGNPYSWQDADSSNDCSNTPAVMNPASGSALYYSQSNPLKAIGYNQYIPNAWGYPFSQQAYTADLTGRIKYSSGPGLYHHMGTDHITQYLYGAPSQQELTRLFDTEVGVASHYFKNATIDPNGQTTVTYTDMHGRTIATALSGTPLFASLDTLSEFRMDTIVDAILDTTTNVVEGDSIICTKTFMSLVAPIDTYFFKYTLFPLSDTVYLCNGSEFCFDCIYDITIKVTDDCNNHKMPGDTAYVVTLHDYSPSQSLNNFDTLCSNLPPIVVDSFYLGLPPGTYTITKTLTINSNAINYYYNYYLTRDTCLKNFNDFYVNALNQVDMSGCNMNCQQCEQQLGDSATFVNKYLRAIVAQDSLAQLQHQDTLNASAAYTELKSYCNMLCDSFTICDEKRLMMIHDMSPGGQYAMDTPNYQATDRASIFYNGSNSAFLTAGGGQIFSQLPLYSNPAIQYLNAQGVPDTLYVDTSAFNANYTDTGTLVRVLPNQLSIQNFEKYWKPSWANALLPYHPEYCFFEFCEDNSASNEYDSWIMSITSYDTALYYGLMNPLSYLSDPNCPFAPATSPRPDPFFATTGMGSAFASVMQGKMDVFAQTGGSPDTTVSIWQLVAETASNGTSLTPGGCPNCMKNYYWMNFRSIYEGLKQTCVDLAMQAWVHNSNNCNKQYPTFNSSSSNPLCNKTPRWGAIADSLWANSNLSNPALMDSAHAVFSRDSTGGFTCTDYAPYWWQKLSQCGIPQADSALIISELVAVCRLGTDSTHIYGATSTPGPTHTTANGNWTFEQALNWATTATAAGTGGLVPWTYHQSDSCTSLLITNPMPYNTPILYYESDAIKPPDTCTCRKIMAYYNTYAASDSSIMSFSKYLNYYYNMTIDSEDASILVSACNNPTCLLLPHPVEVPYQFECKEECVTCAQVQAAYTAFLDSFPGVTASVNYLTLMQAFMNAQLGFNITAQEYLNFLNDSCGQNVYVVDTTSPAPQNCPTPSNSNSSINVIAGCTSTVSVVSGSCSGNCNAGIISVNTGNASANGGQIIYTAQGAAGSYDTVTYRVCNQCGVCDTAKLFVSIITGTCTVASSAVNQYYYICAGDSQVFLPVQGNTPPAGSQFYLAGFVPATPTGVTQSYNTFTFHASATAGADTFKYIICSTGGGSTVCDTAKIFIQINSCNWDTSGGGIQRPVRRKPSGKLSASYQAAKIESKKTLTPDRLHEGYLGINVYLNSLLKPYNTYKFSPTANINYAQIFKSKFQHTAIDLNSAKIWSGNVFASTHPSTFAVGKTYLNEALQAGFTKWQKARSINVHDSIANFFSHRSRVGGKYGSNKLAHYLANRQDKKSLAYSMYFRPIPKPAAFNIKADEYLKKQWANGIKAANSKAQSLNNQTNYNKYKQESIKAYEQAMSQRNTAKNKLALLKKQFIENMNRISASALANNKLKSLNTNAGNIGIHNARLVSGANNVGQPVMSAGASYSSMPLYKEAKVPERPEASAGAESPHRMRLLPGGLGSWCDTLRYLVNQYDSIYVATGTSNYGTLLNFMYDSLGTYQDIAYWQQQFANCGITCPPIVNCGTVSSIMSTFESTYPQFSTHCPPYIWSNYLNTNGGGIFGGSNYWFGPNQWMSILTCCGVSYPGPDTFASFCDSITAVLPFCTTGQPGTMSCLQNLLDNTMGWNYDPITNQFGDITYWITKFNTCDIACSSVLPCSLYDSLMTAFKTNNPTLADSCPPFIWVNYMNQSSGAWYQPQDWMSMLQCCGASYPVADTLHNHCDSVNAVIHEFNAQAANGGGHGFGDLENMLSNVFGCCYIDSTGNWRGRTDSEWFAMLDSCHAACPNIINCQHVDSLVNTFVSYFPPNTVPAFMLYQYLNQNGGGVTYANGQYFNYWFSADQWKILLKCCNINITLADSGLTTCDSLRDVITLFNAMAARGQSHSLWDFQGYIGNYISWGYDISYWFGLINSCNLSCPNIINCQYADSLVNVFATSFPSGNVPSFMLANYLNQNNAGMNGTFGNVWYNSDEWKFLLKCCNITLHTDSPTTLCDSLRDVITYFNSQAANGNSHNLWDFEGDIGNYINWGYDINYIFSEINSCHLTCPNIINCQYADSLLNALVSQNPEFDTIPDFMWTGFLNSANAGNNNWYSTQQWRMLLSCCNPPVLISDSVTSTCDSLRDVVKYFNYQATQNPGSNQNIWAFEHDAGMFISYGFNDSSGQWHNYDYSHWVPLMDSCHISCPNVINCYIADSLMRVFIAQTPGVADSCPVFVWANYLNQANFTNGNWYSPTQWLGMMQCCGVHYPRPDTLHTYCDTVSFIVNTNIDTLPFPLVGIITGLSQTFNNGDSSVAYWLNKLNQCGYNCSQFSNCHLLDSVLNKFKAQYPQYTDTCPAAIITGYLNLTFFGGGGNNKNNGGTYNDFVNLYACCGIVLPSPSDSLGHCDTAAAANIMIQYYESFLSTILDSTCKPAWVWNLLLGQGSFLQNYATISSVTSLLNSCGFSSPDTCVLLSKCDSLNNIYQVFTDIWNWQASGGNGGNNGNDFAGQFTQFYDQQFNSTANYVQIMAQMLACGNHTLCDSLNSQIIPIISPILAAYDSLCIDRALLGALFNVVTSSNLTSSEWLQILQTCGETLPPICNDTAATTCQKVLEADTLAMRIVNMYGANITHILPKLISNMLGYQVSYAVADSLDSVCSNRGAACSAVLSQYRQFSSGLNLDSCYPAWLLLAIWDALAPQSSPTEGVSPLVVTNYSGLCNLFSACNLPCPDTCGAIGNTHCDTIIAIYNVFEQISAAGVADSFTVLRVLMRELLHQHYPTDASAYGALIGQYEKCSDGCSGIVRTAAIMDSMFASYPGGAPAYIIVSLFNAINAPHAPLSTLQQVDSVFAQCGISFTAGDLPGSFCDSVNAAMNLYHSYLRLFPNINYSRIAADTLMGYLFNIGMGCSSPWNCYGKQDIINMVDKCDSLTCADIWASWDLLQHPLDSMANSGIYVSQAIVDSLFLHIVNNYKGCYGIMCYNLNQIYGLYFKCIGPACIESIDSASAAWINNLINIFVTSHPSLLNGTQAALNSAMYAYLDSVCNVSGVNWCNLRSKCPSLIVCPTVNPNNGGIHYLCNRPLFPPIQAFTDDSCMATMQQYALQNASMEYQDYLQTLHDSFVNQYINKCLGVWRNEHLYDRHRDGEYHYTLYYYDQAGNLVQTVPPNGAIPDSFPHTYPTKYRYNTQNQVVEQVTPDADTSYFWYDRILKLAFSQNGKQRALNQMSYTNYDPLQRIIEVGRYDGFALSANYGFWDYIAVNDPNWYNSLISSNHYPREVTHTYYDNDYLGIAPRFQSIGMTNLRNRVASIIYADTLTPDSSQYAAATHFSYDPDGNVQTLLQENRRLKQIGQDFKRVDYSYDLISGKVNNVSYQSGQPDAFYHFYDYDADNRITDVYTSRDSIFFDHDAHYEYYLHGPLARAVIGDKQVQAINYAYTIQGWLKAINGDKLWGPTWMGQDGGQYTPNWLVGIDVYGFSLGYFTGDYSPINAGNSPVGNDTAMEAWDLYNGNISRSKGFNLALNGLNLSSQPASMAYRYRYDQLNRLTGMNASSYTYNASDSTLNFTALQDYAEHVSYDPNGNILSYLRNGDPSQGGPLGMDSLTYKYQPGNNRLDHVNDAVPASNYSVDIDSEDTLNYRYDQIGNLTKDSSGGIDSIYWTVYGKIWQIVKHNGDTIKFAYDPSGNRIMKAVFKDSLNKWLGTYYTHDATGNIMGTYQWYNNDTFNLDELVMYGSSRLGTVNINRYLTDTITRDSAWWAAHPIFTNPFYDSVTYYATGLKQYELTNHLGNVLATLTDKHVPLYIFGGFALYLPEVASAQDYYPFGMIMPGRSYRDSVFRFGFNNKEKDDETYGIGNAIDFGARIHDPRLGRFLSMDPKWGEYPFMSPFCYSANSPILLMDIAGQGPGLNRLFGGLRLLGGTVQIIGGAGLWLTPEPTMLTKVGGTVAIVHGADDFQTGLRQLWTGEEKQSLTEQGIKKTATTLGASDRTAVRIATAADLVLSFVGSGASGAVKINQMLKLGSLTRVKYLEGMADLKQSAELMLKNGASYEEVSKTMVPARNMLKEFVRKGDDFVNRSVAEIRNYFKYNDKLGPTANQLYDKMAQQFPKLNKEETWKKVYESIWRTNETVNKVVKK